jgi:hypothetical protein
MSSGAVALVVACISAAGTIASGWWLERLRRRDRSEIESLKHRHNQDLELLKDQLLRSREAAAKEDEAARVVARYRDPLLRSAYDLQSRIYNIYRPGGFRGGRDPDYFRLNTVFLVAELLGWLEIIRREVQFLDLGAVQATRDLSRALLAVQDQMATTTGSRDRLYIYRGHQRAIGEVMLVPIDGHANLAPRYQCMGYAAFVAAQEDPDFARWFKRLGDAVDQLRNDDSNKPKRLVLVQNALIDLIDLLDPGRERFDKNRERLPGR